MLDLDRHWRDVITVLLQNLACGQAQHREIAQTAEHIRADYKGRFLVELIQNGADQAHAAGLNDGRLLIVQRGGLLAVANPGAPFTDAGIRSITSLGLSTKRPDEAIGNKGVGFKAAFEVTGAPEIYGASTLGSDLADGAAVRFRLCNAPFAIEGALERALDLAAEVRRDEPTLAARLEVRSRTEAVDVADHLRRSPPFKFPLPLAEDAWAARLDQLRLRPADLAGLETLVVLPLAPKTEAVVATALRELTVGDGALALFLPGVHEIVLVDGEHRTVITRREIRREVLDDGTFLDVRTEVDENGVRRGRDWWVARRTYGHAEEERTAVRVAVRGLPGEGWSKVEAVPLAVALPKPDPSSLALKLDGRYVIGLPTLDTTGLAWWVDAHFHGTISRKNLDLATNDLNRLLVGGAAKLIRRLLGRLTAEPGPADAPPVERFGASLALRGDDGPLWQAITAAFSPMDEPIVLAPDGLGFVTVNQLVLPKPSDRAMVLRADPDLQSDALVDAGFVLPHPRLLASGGDHFLDISGLDEINDDAYTERGEDRPALVERWATAHRSAGPSFWQPFLRWLGERFPDEVAELHVLPVAGVTLRRPADWVFLPPRADDPAAPPTEELGAGLRARLSFVDEAAVFGETADPAVRTALATIEPPLLHEPHVLPLLEHAVAPALRAAIEADDRSEADRLLGLALAWAARIPGSAARLAAMDWRVPTETGGWAPAGRAYLSASWTRTVSAKDVELFRAVYGADRLLVSWPALRARLRHAEPTQDATLGALLLVGVATAPRLLTARDVPIVFAGHHGPHHKLKGCPFDGVGAAWDAWLDGVMQLSHNWRRNARWLAVDPTWIDGLERPDTFEALGAWVLAHPKMYADGLGTWLRAETHRHTERATAPWMYALRRANGRVVPTSRQSASAGAPCRPTEACFVPADHRKRGGTSLLHVTAEDFDERFRTALDVVTFASAPASWVVSTLRRLALATEAGESRALEALLTRLWGRLDAALKGLPLGTALEASIVAEPMPVWRGRKVVAAVLRDAPLVYVDDDPFMARYLPDFDRALHLRPSRADTVWATLTTVLTRQLGEGRVVRTSTVEPELSFTPDGDPTPLVGWIEGRSGAVGRLRTDLAVVLKYGGRGIASDERVDALFRRLLAAQVQFGTFASADEPAFWRRREGVLAASSEFRSSPERVLAEAWPAVGEEWREVWFAYGAALASGPEGLDRFFRERRIGEDERDEVRVQLGLEAERLRWLWPALFVRWSVDEGSAGRESFEAEIRRRPADAWAAWLGSEAVAELITRDDVEHRPEAYVPRLGVDWPAWQDARRTLGMEPHTFKGTHDAWRRAVEHVAGCALAALAGGVEGDPASVGALTMSLVPRPLLLAPPDATTLTYAVQSAVSTAGWSEPLCVAVARVVAAPLDDLVPEGIEAAVVLEYRQHGGTERERRASVWWAACRAALDGLARHRGTEDVSAVLEADPSLCSARWGPLANRALLVQRALALADAQAPRAFAALVDAGLEDRTKGVAELSAFTRALAPRVTPPPPRPTSQIAGVTVDLSDAAGTDTLVDTARLIEALAASVADGAALDGLLTAGERSRLDERSPGGAGARGGAGRRASERGGDENEAAKRATGIGGELFAFLQLRAWVPGFDEDCWKSTARQRVGVSDSGDDTLGYDFACVDVDGRLSGRPGVRCLIEVKSSRGPAEPSFPMSRNEWSVAATTHGREDEVYVVLRIENVGTSPGVVDLVVDPFGLLRTGSIRLVQKDLWVTVAPRVNERNGGPVEGNT